MQMETAFKTNRVEILAADDFDSYPITVAGTAVVKAGTPLTADGAVATNESNAAGLLLYDVDPNVNPNGALLVRGIVNARIARQYSGATLDAATLKTAVPGLTLREDAPLRYTNTFQPAGV